MKFSTPLTVALSVGILASNTIDARNLKGKEYPPSTLELACSGLDGDLSKDGGTCAVPPMKGEVTESRIIIVGTHDRKNDALGELQFTCAEDETLLGCYSLFRPNIWQLYHASQEAYRSTCPLGAPEDNIPYDTEGSLHLYHGIYSQIEEINTQKGSCKSRLFDERGRKNLPDEPNPGAPLEKNVGDMTSGAHYLFGTCAKFTNYSKEDTQTSQIKKGEWEVKESTIKCPTDMTVIACYGNAQESEHIVQSTLSVERNSCTSTLAGNLTGFEDLKVKASALCFKHEHFETTVVQASEDKVKIDGQGDWQTDRYAVVWSPPADGEFTLATGCSCTGNGCWGSGFELDFFLDLDNNGCFSTSECPTCIEQAEVTNNLITATNLKFHPKN